GRAPGRCGAQTDAPASRSRFRCRGPRGAPVKRCVLLLASSAVLAGCVVGPAYKRPTVALPDRVYGQAVSDAASLADVPWWEVFRDPVLRALVEEALRSGYDVRIAAARVEEARARFGIARASRFPEVGYGAGYARQRVPDEDASNDYVAHVNVGWELDVWGRVRRLNESAKAQYLTTEEARRGVMLSLVAEVA